MDRREFLQLLGSAMALSACTKQPNERIAPYVRQPEGMTLGQPLYFASALSIGGLVQGVLVTSREGRPIKIEGNPDHPASLGATDRFSQAALLDLYDPDRAKVVTSGAEIQPYATLVEALQQVRQRLLPLGGAGLRLLTETVASPTLRWQIQSLLTDFPQARWHEYEPALPDHALRGTALALGTPLVAQPHIDRADVIFSVDGDFLSGTPNRHGGLRSVGDFAGRRQPENGPPCRLYVAEATVTCTGAKADHALRLRPSQLWLLLRTVAARLGVGAPPVGDLPEPAGDFVAALVADLQRSRGRGLVLVGDYQPPRLHALGALLNHALGNAGITLTYTTPAMTPSQLDQMVSLRALSDDMGRGLVGCLLCLGGNPVYTAPADLRFGEHLQRVPLSVHLSPYLDETAALTTWHVPASHPLESWSDASAADGTASIVQPLIEPLYESRSAHELLAALTSQPVRDGHQLVRAYWQTTLPAGDFEAAWRGALRAGVVPGTAGSPVAVAPVLPAADLGEEPAPAGGGLEVAFRPDPTLLDGRYANNAWLQELPKPLSSLTWDLAVVVGPATARRLGFLMSHGDQGREVHVNVAQVTLHGRSLRAPVWVQQGQPDGCVTLHLGGGRTRAGHVGDGIGYDANQLRSAAAPWHDGGLVLQSTGEHREIGVSQVHHRMEGRDQVRVVHADLPVVQRRERHLSLYSDFRYEGYAWGMAIDLAACVGCGACVLACQAENNIPVVGPEEARRGREMHWIRVDCYDQGDDPAQPEILFQPVPCMHCENAPCELVCPVEATVHDAEGLNAMVYNRCVGTRYCSNNCPYKVRRFNFLLYQDWDTPSLKAMRNPEVTVRSRGVMEKCTYCVQRIAAARSASEREDRRIRDGEVRTACQQVCPARAIVFGDLNDPQSAVHRRKASQRDYDLLGELNTRPRTTYQAEVKNPAPGLGPKRAQTKAG